MSVPNASIGVFVLVWNEAIMLPHFIRHYLPNVDGIEIYNHGTTDGSIDHELSKLEPQNRTKVHIHDISSRKGIHELNHVQNTEWVRDAAKYDVVIHVDADEFMISDNKIVPETLRQCLQEFYKSEATFATVAGYECTMSLSRELLHTDDIVTMATHGCPYSNLDRPCILKPNKFKEWNLALGRHTWNPVGTSVKNWARHPILKHIRGANIDTVLKRRIQINKRMSLKPFTYNIDNLRNQLDDFQSKYVLL